MGPPPPLEREREGGREGEIGGERFVCACDLFLVAYTDYMYVCIDHSGNVK